MAQTEHAHDVLMSARRSPSILAYILGCAEENIYQMEKNGKLPADRNTSNIECLRHRFAEMQKTVNAKRTTMGEAKLEQDIRNGMAKEVLQWLEVKEKKESLVEVHTLKDNFEAVFHTINSGLVNITREYPETQKAIDKMLASWNELGQKMVTLAGEEGAAFVDAQINKELEIELDEPDSLEEGGLSNFGKWEKRE